MNTEQGPADGFPGGPKMEAICRALGDHPKWTLLITLSLMIPLYSYFLIYPFQIESDVRRGFAQKNGRSSEEFRAFAEYYNITYEGLEIWVVLATPKASAGKKFITMSDELLSELTRLDNFVQNFSVPMGDTAVTFRDTHSGEDLNYLLYWFKKTYGLKGFLPDINLTYPIADVMGHKLFLASHFFGVNEETTNLNVPMETMKYVSLWYMSKAPTYNERKKLQAIEWGLFEMSLQDNFSDLFSIEMYGDQVANAEMLRGTVTTVKLFIVGVVLMIAFMLYMFRHMTIKAKIWMTFGAILAPTLATTTTFALLGWVGVAFNSIMCITPFLVLGIGVDDAFLLLHNWRHTQREGVLANRVRMHRVLTEIGPSMTITSITNMMAFGMGILSPTPQMTTFCLCTAIAVLFDFIYEFLIFAPIMVIFYEEAPEKEEEKKEEDSFFSYRNYCSILLTPAGRVILFLALGMMYFVAGVGLSEMLPSFEPSKTFPSDSNLLQSLKSFELIQTEYWPVNFISHNPPRTIEERERWEEMLKRLETRSHCYGRDRTINFLRAYLDDQSVKTGNKSIDNFSFEPLEGFLRHHLVDDKQIVQYHKENESVHLDGANYVVICKVHPKPSGETDWNKRAFLVKETREIVDEYGEFNTTIFDYDSTIYDVIITVKHEMIKAVGVTFLCMTIVSVFLIPNFVGATLATVSMLSISLCMLGFLSHWGCSLDPIVMINVLMAIGFSVDFSAHICFHYHTAIKSGLRETTLDRLTRILTAVGRPMVEASLSTIICMLPLFFVKIYIITSFAKTVCLVASLGLVHGIVIIPLILGFLKGEKQPSQQSSQNILTTTTEESERMLV